jgi:hypothetical protein
LEITMRTLVVLFVFAALLPATARAERYGAFINGSEHVVHTRRAPVVLHRAVPPYKGVHVYQGRR